MTETKFNINQNVKVKLNTEGLEILKLNDIIPRIDEQGYWEAQMYFIFYIFGSYLLAGRVPPFDSDIILIVK